MAKRKKRASSKGRRAALKGFAKGAFQSPVHSNGFKQDILIDLYGGDKGLDHLDNPSANPEGNRNIHAATVGAAGREYFFHGGKIWKAVPGGRSYVAEGTAYAGKVKIGEVG